MTKKLEQSTITFAFPTVNREIKKVKNVRVEPFWECAEGRFIGVFRIVAELTFGKVNIVEAYENSIAIDAIDVDQDDGYFEYAISFEGEGEIESIVANSPIWETEGQLLHLNWMSHIELRKNEVLLKNELEEVPAEKIQVNAEIKTNDVAIEHEAQAEQQIPNQEAKVKSVAVEQEADVMNAQAEQQIPNQETNVKDVAVEQEADVVHAQVEQQKPIQEAKVKDVAVEQEADVVHAQAEQQIPVQEAKVKNAAIEADVVHAQTESQSPSQKTKKTTVHAFLTQLKDRYTSY